MRSPAARPDPLAPLTGSCGPIQPTRAAPRRLELLVRYVERQLGHGDAAVVPRDRRRASEGPRRLGRAGRLSHSLEGRGKNGVAGATDHSVGAGGPHDAEHTRSRRHAEHDLRAG